MPSQIEVIEGFTADLKCKQKEKQQHCILYILPPLVSQEKGFHLEKISQSVKQHFQSIRYLSLTSQKFRRAGAHIQELP